MERSELQVWRVLDREPCLDLAHYVEAGGGRGLDAARRLGGGAVVDEIVASGLRGRGGAGFPTGRKWATVTTNRSDTAPTTMVVNGAEGEPATFKDRTILRRNPYKVLEGALIAALAVGAPRVVVGLKASFGREHRRLSRAIAELEQAGWTDGVALSICLGPDAYLFGEETGLLEVVEGRQPFPRVTPPYRRGLDVEDPGSSSGRGAAGIELADPAGTDEPPALVDNVETLANVAGILAEGADWFRAWGTEGSPGTIVCTLIGDVAHHGVAEVPMGTRLGELIDLVGRGPRPGRHVVALLPGAANPLIPADLFDTPMTYEDLQAVGSGLGSAGFTAVDDRTDPVAVAQGVARFLAVESCGQCEPCKRDGLALARYLDDLRRSALSRRDRAALDDRVRTVATGARCSLATQQERVVTSVLSLYPDLVDAHVDGSLAATDPVLVAPILELSGGRAVLDERHARKQPDWSYDEEDSGAWPAAALGNTPVHVAAPSSSTPAGASSRADAASRPAGDAGGGGALDDTPDRPVPLESLRRSHRRIAAIAARARGAEASSALRKELLGELVAELAVHDDVNERILYPMLRRVAGDEGEALADEAGGGEHPLVQRLHRIVDGPSVDDQHLSTLSEELEERFAEDERRVEPLLLRHLDADARADLDDALEEARLTSREQI